MLRSLKSRLLAWLVVPLLFMSGAHLTSIYIDTQKTAEDIFDKLLVTLALSISEHALSSGGDLLTDDLVEIIRETTNDNLYYKVIGPGGAFITGYEDIPEPEGGIQVLETNLQFYDAIYIDQAVRVIAVSSLIDRPEYSGWMTTFVAQTINERDRYVESTLFNNTWRVVLMISIASGLLSIGVSLGLRPLIKLQKSVHNRTTHDLSPIKNENLPYEISGLVDELNELLGRLSDHISLTKRFVENAAHQLRTPVTALLPQSELALRHAESERERTAIEKIKNSARKIARLTHQLLNLTHAESISLSKHEYARIELKKVVVQRVAAFRELYPRVKLKKHLSEAPMDGIELFVGEIIDNLLDNTRKYADVDEPVSINTYSDQNDAILEVVDKGPGIPENLREKAVERFERLSADGSGSGLGLAIVKEIVEAHEGRLEIADNEESSGTCVRCFFPLAN